MYIYDYIYEIIYVKSRLEYLEYLTKSCNPIEGDSDSAFHCASIEAGTMRIEGEINARATTFVIAIDRSIGRSTGQRLH